MKVRITREGRNYVKFKTPNPTQGTSANFESKLRRLLKKKSLEFAGVDISKVFFKANGDYRIYGRRFFKNTETGKTYYWIGMNTENWKGFSLLFVEMKPDDIVSYAGDIYNL